VQSSARGESDEDRENLHEPNETEEGNTEMPTASEHFDVARMITECLGRYDCVPPPDDDSADDDEDDFAVDDDNLPDLRPDNLIHISSVPLYEGCKTKLLVAVLLIFNCFTVHGVSNSCADELLNVISELLPKGNKLPKSHLKGNKLIRTLGLNYKLIHACRNGCCLFRGDLAEALTCPKCGEQRYRSENSGRAAKILRHFPLIPRLLRMYRCKEIAELNKWHTSRKDMHGNMECVPDSKAWKHINALYPEFAAEERNVRLGLATDGVNPFSNQSLSHSTWPVILLNYNLPPWLVTKRFFLMLALIIPGKCFVM
jgi:hypothetical protein